MRRRQCGRLTECRRANPPPPIASAEASAAPAVQQNVQQVQQVQQVQTTTVQNVTNVTNIVQQVRRDHSSLGISARVTYDG